MSQYDPLDLREQERQKADAERRDRLEQDQEGDDIKWLMGSRQGRRIVWRLLDQSGVFRLSFTPNAVQTAFNEGCRNFGLRTLGLIHSLCPELYHPMVKEHADGRVDAGNARKSK